MGGLIPLSDASRRPSHAPVVTIGIILANVCVFVLELRRGDPFVLHWSAVPAQIIAGHRWITGLTSMFLHASWSHILGNMIFLWAFGPEIEDRMNPFRYAAFYLCGGMAALLAQIGANPTSTVPNLGASGAIAAVMGAFLVAYPRDRIRSILIIFLYIRITFVPAILLIGFWFLIQLLDAGAVSAVHPGGVAYVAHVAGFVFGALTVRLFDDPRRIRTGLLSDTR
ncbi:MAG: rhomboid family intramembrane serine protease [Silvibacterium sp.]|nr:rhomboid family intramembrane serine protease [Silvibacterium sp.]